MERLERFEKALQDILDEYDNLGKELEKLRSAGKSKTTKFRELLGKKLVYSMIITIFKRYDLIEIQDSNLSLGLKFVIGDMFYEKESNNSNGNGNCCFIDFVISN